MDKTERSESFRYFYINVKQKDNSSIGEELQRIEYQNFVINETINQEIYFISLPRILVLNINRLIFDPETNTSKKIFADFHIDDEIKLLNRGENQNYTYKLFATVVDIGKSGENGHYIALLRFVYNGNIIYIKFNDKLVSEISENDFIYYSNGNIDEDFGASIAFYIKKLFLHNSNQINK